MENSGADAPSLSSLLSSPGRTLSQLGEQLEALAATSSGSRPLPPSAPLSNSYARSPVSGSVITKGSSAIVTLVPLATGFHAPSFPTIGIIPSPRTAALRHGEKCDKFTLMTASVTDLRRKTTELLDEVKRGEDVEIQHHGKTIARLVPEAKPSRPAGRHAGSVLRSLREARPALPPPVDPEEDIIIADRRRRLSA